MTQKHVQHYVKEVALHQNDIETIYYRVPNSRKGQNYWSEGGWKNSRNIIVWSSNFLIFCLLFKNFQIFFNNINMSNNKKQ